MLIYSRMIPYFNTALHSFFHSLHQQSVLLGQPGRNVVLCKTDCWCDEKKKFAMNTQQELTLKPPCIFHWLWIDRTGRPTVSCKLYKRDLFFQVWRMNNSPKNREPNSWTWWVGVQPNQPSEVGCLYVSAATPWENEMPWIFLQLQPSYQLSSLSKSVLFGFLCARVKPCFFLFSFADLSFVRPRKDTLELRVNQI